MISLLLAACRSCDYGATVGTGWDEGATIPVHWAPANCPACGLVSVNVYSYGHDTKPRYHERVDFYVDWGSALPGLEPP